MFLLEIFPTQSVKLRLPFQLTSILSSHIQNPLDQTMQLLRTKLSGSLSYNLMAVYESAGCIFKTYHEEPL